MSAHRTWLPARPLPPVFSSQAPIAVAGALAALLVGVLLAKDVALGSAALLGLLYAPLVLIDLPLGVALWVPLVFVERVPAANIGPAAVTTMVGIAWLATLPARRRVVVAILRRHIGLVFTVLLLLTWVTFSVIWSVDPAETVGSFGFWWISAAILLVVSTSLTRRRHLAMVCAAFVAGALISVMVGYIPGIDVPSDVAGSSEAGRLAGSYGDPNFLAAGIVPAIALTVGLGATTSVPRRRALLLACAVVLAAGLLASGSRGGLLAAVTIAVGTLFVARGHRRAIFAVFVAALALGVLWTAATSSSNLDRVRHFDTGNGRVDLWTIALRMGRAQPVNGVGLGGFPDASAAYLRRPGRLQSGQLGAQLVLEKPHEAHNTYLQLFAETGVVGLGLFVAAIILALKASWMAAQRFERGGDRRYAALARSVLLAQVAALIAAAFITNPTDKRMWILLGLGPALLTVASRMVDGGGGQRWHSGR
jgi:O-antigen ligase